MQGQWFQKMEELKILANKTKASVICISETWIDETVTNSEIKIPGYNVIRKDRNKNGGGVCMYIITGVAYNQRTDLAHDSLEAIWCDILLPKTKPFIIGCCYRPPKQTYFVELLEECISKVGSEMEVLILGDMNICVSKKLGYLYNKYMNIQNMYSMSQLINEITRETKTSATILDHIICSRKEKISQHGVLPIGISDHYVTYCTRKVTKECLNKHNTIKIRSMKTYNVQIFNENLASEEWDNVYNSETVDEAWNNFKEILVKVLDLVAPIKEIRIKQRTEAWINSDILEGLKERDELLAEYKKDKDNDEKYKKFCKARNKIQQEIKKTKSEYISNKIQENKGNSKKLWQQLKNLGYSRNSKED